MDTRVARYLSLVVIAIGLVTTGCTSQKNTSGSRFWHAFNAKYNTYYNGTLAYIDGSLEKEQGNVDNFTEMIPLYTVGNKSSVDLGKGNFEKAIEKCEKAIHQHSIKKRPVWDKRRRKTQKDIEWLNRREYNPFLWKAWMLMGRSQFFSGQFEDAASTFAYMSRLYETQPAIYGRARAWLAKCYIEQDWMYDAEDVIRNMERDSIHWRAQKEWDYTYADYYIHTGDFEQAIPYLRKVIRHEMRRKQKAREWYLMGQLQAALHHNTEAYKAFKHVVRLNPPYQLEFNARIAMTEVLARGQAKKMIGRLKRMARSDNNSEYLDQVYYAIGNIYLAQKDTVQAIAAYEKGNEKATRSGIEKGVLLLHLGDLYWQKEKFSDARRCYGEAIGLLDKERDDYEQLSNRSKVLDELVPYTDAVHLQDSLQALAKMDETERNKAIDRVIDALKKKEKEERNKQAEENSQRIQQQNGALANMNRNNQRNTPTTTQNNGLWYFYNATAVNQGKATFQRQWGKRENVDNWQRINKTVVASAEGVEEMSDSMRDSLARAAVAEDSLKQITDSAQNDPHKREYYLAQIPFTEEQVQASNAILEDGLFHSGVIFKDKLDNLPLSEKALRRLVDHYPDYEKMADAYYHLYLLYNRKGEPATADIYVDSLKQKYPDNEYTKLLTDPYFKENARLGVHIEDSLYTATYEAFKKDRYDEVAGNTRISASRFPLGANRDKFLFIGGLSKLNSGDAEGCLTDMKEVVAKYPESRLAEMAGMIVNGVNQGRQLRGGKFDLGDVWNRRSVVLNDSDSTTQKQFSNERNANFVFMVVYKPDSVDENKLLFNLAKFNFTTYLVRNFDINIEEQDGLHRMTVAGFRNYDEVLQYARSFYQQPQLLKVLGKSRTVIISEVNLPLLGTRFTYNDYDKFYNKHFAPLKVNTFRLLVEPEEIITRPVEEPTPEQIDNELDNGNIDNGLDITPLEENDIKDNGLEFNPESEQNTPDNGLEFNPENEQNTPDNGLELNPENEQNTPDNRIENENITPQPSTDVISVETTTSSKDKDNKDNNPSTTSSRGNMESQEVQTKPSTSNTNTKEDEKGQQPVEDTGIYFDDGFGQQSGNNKNTNQTKEKEPKQENFDLEDEYYDLEGF